MNRFSWMTARRERPGAPNPFVLSLSKHEDSRPSTASGRTGAAGKKAQRALWVVLTCWGLAPVSHAQQLLAWPVGRPPIALPPDRVGMPIPRPGPIIGPGPIVSPRPDVVPLPLGEHKLNGTVKSQIATLWIDITFRNDTAQRLEGELFMPIPADAVIDKLEMHVGDKVMRAELLDADRARATYEMIVRQMRDPALLELQSERLVRCRVFPIEPRSTVKLRFNYTQLLGKAGGLYSLRLPAVQTHGGAATHDVKLDFEAQAPIRMLYSPTHSVDIQRDGDKKAVIKSDGKGGGEMVVLFSLEEGDLASSLLTYREPSEDGTFMVSLAPKLKAEGRPEPKDIVFVVDRSGSMEEGNLIEQARGSLRYCLSKLNPQDRFGIVDFATGVNSFRPALVQADPQHKAAARRYVDRLEASGGTNIQDALEAALKMLGPSATRPGPEGRDDGSAGGAGRMPMIVFLTDGLPTVGETDTDALLRKVHDSNKRVNARLFALGAGSDVNSLFIDKLAEGQRGARDYILPGENIEVKVGQLYDRIAKPALTDVRLEWEGVDAKQVYPKEVFDLYYGDPLVLMGRYGKAGKGKLIVTGRTGGKPVRLEFPLDLPKEAEKDAYLPRLWAHRKVAHLLDEVRLTGTKNPEIVREITKLAKQYGIVTPYTSLFIAEEKDMAALRREATTAFEAMAADAASTGGSASGRAGMRMSRMLSAAKAAAPAASSLGLLGGAAFDDGMHDGRSQMKEVEMRQAGAKTFYRRDSGWVDGAFEAADEAPKVEEVVFASERYFELLRTHPVGSSRVDLQACKLEYSIVSPK